MGIYIKGMEKPRKCIRCPVNLYGRCLVNNDKDVSKATADAVRDEDCPIISDPPHGDLIERKAICLTDFEIAMCNGDYKEGMKMLLKKIESAPTIIPAEEGET